MNIFFKKLQDSSSPKLFSQIFFFLKQEKLIYRYCSIIDSCITKILFILMAVIDIFYILFQILLVGGMAS